MWRNVYEIFCFNRFQNFSFARAKTLFYITSKFVCCYFCIDHYYFTYFSSNFSQFLAFQYFWFTTFSRKFRKLFKKIVVTWITTLSNYVWTRTKWLKKSTEWRTFAIAAIHTKNVSTNALKTLTVSKLIAHESFDWIITKRRTYEKSKM